MGIKAENTIAEIPKTKNIISFVVMKTPIVIPASIAGVNTLCATPSM